MKSGGGSYDPLRSSSLPRRSKILLTFLKIMWMTTPQLLNWRNTVFEIRGICRRATEWIQHEVSIPETATDPNITLGSWRHFLRPLHSMSPIPIKLTPKSTNSNPRATMMSLIYNARLCTTLFKSLFALISPRITRELSRAMSPCSLSILDLDQSASTPYDAVLTLANQMLPAIPAEEAALE